jgi:lipoprotein-anchoring transpeptidase ErfK/SrfK
MKSNWPKLLLFCSALGILFFISLLTLLNLQSPEFKPAKEIDLEGWGTLLLSNNGMTLKPNDGMKITTLPLPEKNCSFGKEIRDGKQKAIQFTIEGQKRIYVYNLTAPVKLAKSYPKVNTKEDFIIIDKSDNLLFFYRNGVLEKSYPVATGKERHYTPEGFFRIVVKEENPKGANSAESQLGVRWMGLSVPNSRDRRGPANDPRAPKGLKFGIHGTNEPHSIGSHASGGCIRMYNEDVTELYSKVKKGTLVRIIP